MKLELRRSGDAVTCESCGSTELLSTHDLPLEVDFAAMVEWECTRRELRLARLFRDLLNELAVEHVQLFTDALGALYSLPVVNVSSWHPVRKRRERLFAERASAAADEFADVWRRAA